MIIAALNLMIENFEWIVDVSATDVHHLPPIVVLFLVGVFDKKGNAHGAFMTLVLGTFLVISLFYLHQTNVWPIHFIITAGFVVGVCALIFIGFSRMSPPPTQEVIEKYTFKKELIHQENEGLAWYQNYQYWALLLFFCIVTLFFILF